MLWNDISKGSKNTGTAIKKKYIYQQFMFGSFWKYYLVAVSKQIDIRYFNKIVYFFYSIFQANSGQNFINVRWWGKITVLNLYGLSPYLVFMVHVFESLRSRKCETYLFSIFSYHTHCLVRILKRLYMLYHVDIYCNDTAIRCIRH